MAYDWSGEYSGIHSGISDAIANADSYFGGETHSQAEAIGWGVGAALVGAGLWGIGWEAAAPHTGGPGWQINPNSYTANGDYTGISHDNDFNGINR